MWMFRLGEGPYRIVVLGKKPGQATVGVVEEQFGDSDHNSINFEKGHIWMLGECT